jgi:putative membrane protein
MIDYEPHDWWSHFWDVKGSMVREIGGRVALFTLWSTAVVVVDKSVGDLPVVGDWSISLSLLAVIGSALGFLLVFRTNSAYDKFWEGRKLWGGIVNESRNLARQAVVHLDDEPALRDEVLGWTAAWPYLAKHLLRGTPAELPAETARRLPAERVAAILRAQHPPLAVSTEIAGLLARARDRGLLSDYLYGVIDQNNQLLIDYMGACERIV